MPCCHWSSESSSRPRKTGGAPGAGPGRIYTPGGETATLVTYRNEGMMVTVYCRGVGEPPPPFFFFLGGGGH